LAEGRGISHQDTYGFFKDAEYFEIWMRGPIEKNSHGMKRNESSHVER